MDPITALLIDCRKTSRASNSGLLTRPQLQVADSVSHQSNDSRDCLTWQRAATEAAPVSDQRAYGAVEHVDATRRADCGRAAVPAVCSARIAQSIRAHNPTQLVAASEIDRRIPAGILNAVRSKNLKLAGCRTVGNCLLSVCNVNHCQLPPIVAHGCRGGRITGGSCIPDGSPHGSL